MRDYRVSDVLRRLQLRKDATRQIPAPPYAPPAGKRDDVLFAVETFKRHMTDEAWQLQIGLESAGHTLYGRYFEHDEVDLLKVVRNVRPGTAILQDKREWDPEKNGCFDKTVAFQHVDAAAKAEDVFRLTIHKDLQNDPRYNYLFHRAWNPHAWIIYYHPQIAAALCPWIRPEHMLRVYHMLDPEKVPAATEDRPGGCLVSGRLRRDVYPLRQRAADWAVSGHISHTEVLHHPGYHANGVHTDSYLETLSLFKVSICTASIFGYSLRKIIESTACGCVVITDLPADDVLPGIDANLVRVHPDISHRHLADVIRDQIYNYDPDRQAHFADIAKGAYDYRVQCRHLADSIETMRRGWSPVAAPVRERIPVTTKVKETTVFKKRPGQTVPPKVVRIVTRTTQPKAD